MKNRTNIECICIMTLEGWKFFVDDDDAFSIELTYYFHSHFVSSIMSLFKCYEMLAIFDTLLFCFFLLCPLSFECALNESTRLKSIAKSRCVAWINVMEQMAWDLCVAHNANGFASSIAFDSQTDYNRHRQKHRKTSNGITSMRTTALASKQHNEMTQSREFGWHTRTHVRSFVERE